MLQVNLANLATNYLSIETDRFVMARAIRVHSAFEPMTSAAPFPVQVVELWAPSGLLEQRLGAELIAQRRIHDSNIAKSGNRDTELVEVVTREWLPTQYAPKRSE